MSAREDYAKLNANTSGPRHQGQTSCEAQAALDEIDRLRRWKAEALIVLDERGTILSSPKFAERLAHWRDQGQAEACFVIGGADGIAPEIRDRADFALSLGKMVWPHMLARVMLTEQLYRAASILAGAPYHRE